MRFSWAAWGIVLCLAMLLPSSCRTSAPRIGSKAFTESVVLGEVLRLLAEDEGTIAVHHHQMGGTRIVFDYLVAGDIDVYPDYTGTVALEILQLPPDTPNSELAAQLDGYGIAISESLGFENNYALAMRRDMAEKLNITSISDLRKNPELALGFSSEFIERADGWHPLAEHYGLSHQNVKGLEHELAYRMLKQDQLQVIDVYTTDANIRAYDLQLLTDDRQFFPSYDAVFLYRQDLEARYPNVVKAIQRLTGNLDSPTMIQLNHRATLGQQHEAAVAEGFLLDNFGVTPNQERDPTTRRHEFWIWTVEHLDLVRRSLAAAILTAIPLGIVAAKWRSAGQVILVVVGLVQTIPALALLVVLIAPTSALGLSNTGSNSASALIALYLYSLLPIVRNTHAGLSGIAPPLQESATVLGLSPLARLRSVEMPLASPLILAGIKIAAVINVGFATLGGLIGAGGFGQPIITGLRKNDTNLVLQGASAAAILALLVLGVFELAERRLVPRGLQLRTGDKQSS